MHLIEELASWAKFEDQNQIVTLHIINEKPAALTVWYAHSILTIKGQ